jgi:periplasmic protein TonB
MSTYRADPSRPDRAKAIAGVAVVYAVLVGAALLMPSDSPLRVQNDPTVLIDVKEIPEPQPPPEEDPGKAREEEGAAGKKAEPTPVVAPKPAIEVPAKPPIVAAPIAGTGSAATAGAATTGTGPGAGGSGSGRGGGGSGGGGGGIGSDAKLLGGNSAKLPARILRGFAADRGYGYLLLTVSEEGRVSDCSVMQTTGSGEVDQALCDLMIGRSRWSPARDTQGRPISVKLRYTATWSKN